MGQINLSRITTTSSIITPPDGCDAMYNQNGVFYFLNSSGQTSSFIQTSIDGVGRTNYLPLWTDDDSLSISSLYQSGTTLYSNTLTGPTNSLIISDNTGKIYNSNIVIKQIAVTVSGAEIATLFSSPKTLIPTGSGTTTHQVISAYARVNVVSGAWSGNTNLVLFEGGNGVTHECNALATTQIRRYRFIPRNTSSSLVQTQNDDAAITLSVDTGNPTGATSNGTLTIYLTYTTYDEGNISYQP
jgi:hypothetical protein